MDTDDTINDAPTPADDRSPHSEPPQPQADSLWREPIFAVPALGWCALSIYWLWQGIPFYLAIPAGCVLGMTLFFITSAVVGTGFSTLQELGCGGIISLTMALILTPVFPAAREKAFRSRCLGNVKAASHALLLYAQDNDERFPPAAQWQAAVTTYLPRTPKDQGRKSPVTLACPRARHGTGYAFFAPLSVQSPSALLAPAFTPLVFDADVSSPGVAARMELLPQPERHKAGNVIGFADGHVRCQERRLTLAATPPARRLYTKSTMLGARSQEP